MAVDLTTTYLGLELRSPLLASASPLTGSLETLVALEQAGAGAVVLPSLFEEQIEEEGHAETYVDLIQDAKRSLSIPVIASLNGATPGGWARCAGVLQHGGADALELNVYSIETDPYESAAAVEERLVRLVHEVRTEVSIPVAVKLAPYYTTLANVAQRLAQARVDGLVLFNRFLQPEIDLERLDVDPRLELSSPYELRLPLRWIALLHGRVPLSLAGTSGVSTPEDVVKLLLVGADVVMVASELIRRGPGRLVELTSGLQEWLAEHDHRDVRSIRGALSEIARGDRRSFERAQYVGALTAALTGSAAAEEEQA